MIDRARFLNSSDELDPTIVGSGRYAQLTEQEIQRMRYREALQDILKMDSCLLADAKERARAALEDDNGN